MIGIPEVTRAASYFYSTWGWAAMPLENDGNGLPKKPFIPQWQALKLPWEDNLAILPWDRAYGLGLILGPASGNLAVIDVDDQELAEAVFAIAVPKTRCIRTIRQRGHIYLIEEQPSRSTTFHIEWKGRQIGIELKATGTQVAAPPTPGYSHMGPHDQAAMVVSSIRFAWDALAKRLGIRETAPSNSGYPTAWRETVPREQRNKSIYIEAHRLREAWMPMENALRILQVRWEEDYEQGGQAWREVEATIKSAYSKGIPWKGLEVDRDETNFPTLDLFKRR